MPDEGESEGKDFGKFCVFLSRSCGVLSSISETTTCTNIVRNCEQSRRIVCVCVCWGKRGNASRGSWSLNPFIAYRYPWLCISLSSAVVLVCGFVTLLPLPSTLVGGYGQCIAAGLVMMWVPHQDRIRTVARVRACNSVKFETSRNLPPILKIVTHTGHAA